MRKSGTFGDWEIHFKESENYDGEAALYYKISTRYAEFRFNPKLCHHPKAAARHEFGHFITVRLKWLAECRYIQQEEIDEEFEVIARNFEHLLKG